MAFKINDIGGYGSGTLGDVTNPSTQVNSYANITAISGNTITIGTISAGAATFVVGRDVLLHVSAKTTGTDTTCLGNWIEATITAISGSTVTLSKDVSELIPAAVMADYGVQIVTIADYGTLTLSSSYAATLAYSATNKYGGICAIKCKTALVFSGGAINLVDKGIPVANTALRPLTVQESNQSQTGWENHITVRTALMNAGDGVAFVFAKTTTITGTDSRIGGTVAGTACYPYGIGDNSNEEVVGGSTIFWVSETINGFTPTIISKRKASGQGLGRCYIATETALPNDEGLYAQDCLSNPTRLGPLNIKNFGSGTLGDVTNPTGQINSYANITSVNGKIITIGVQSSGIYEKFDVGTEVMFHISRNTGSDYANFGKFMLAKILAVSGGLLTLDTTVATSDIPANYKCQLVTVAQFNTLTINNNYTSTPAYDDSKGYGGICAIKCKGKFDLSNGIINLVGKGIPPTVTRTALPTQCSGQQKDYLPLSQGNGSALIVAKSLTGNAASRIGATYSGSLYGGICALGDGASTTISGITYSSPAQESYSVNGYGPKNGSRNNHLTWPAGGSIGLSGGTTHSAYSITGYGGASIFCVADSIDFFQSMFSTGGKGGNGNYPAPAGGGAGYGGGGGNWSGVSGYGGCGGCGLGGESNYGGMGGGPGTCFIYVNNVTTA
ncbi:MAG TPA: hypothetical protein PKA28_10895 [Methylomusa anaerophila]|uniref:Uncharacterized protein n=1 Tax=Methylomusa anaerophila TaxID=1930071 RepID=A0A348AJ19_9FIRM|nr:hypothetical protein [Methylomusa anaerophila]BBB91067.1 hypothetical protein MAMMFC1_01735 [Methylomusa anaerophila]HML88942.1 hypothetical protein [Methylomusa anaerophila]